MKRLMVFFFFATALTFTACESDSNDPEIIDPTQPVGTFTASRSGDFVAQNNTPTDGSAMLGTDDNGDQFLRFGTDFTTELATGTVSVFLSTSDTFTADPGNGNPDLMLVGVVRGNGEQFYKFDSAVNSKFTHVILWCGTASIPFGYAPLQ